MAIEDGDLGRRYIAAMELTGRYAYAGHKWVVGKVQRILGASITDTVHNHHNYAWRETHGGRELWVSRKGRRLHSPGSEASSAGAWATMP